MNPPGDDSKPAQTGLVDMGYVGFYDSPGLPFDSSDPNHTGAVPTFDVSELGKFAGSFSEIVLNVTWAQLQATQNGPLDTSFIGSAIAAVEQYNAQNNANLGIKLRVWGGYVAPDWAKNIDGPPVTITGEAETDRKNYNDQTIGRFWTADYIAAWTSLQNRLAALYDSSSVIRGISQDAGASATNEPFVPLMSKAPVSAGSSTTVDQNKELEAGGFRDAAEGLTLRAAIADYAAWSTTPLDYPMSQRYLFDSGSQIDDQNFTLAVLQQARNSARIVQVGNHALENPTNPIDDFVYSQFTEDAELVPSVPFASYQTNAPSALALDPSHPYANWPATISNGVQSDAGDIELWDYTGVTGAPFDVKGFTTMSATDVANLATTLASGVAPTTGAPLNGAVLAFFAPANISGAAGAIAFTGTNAVLLASAAAQTSYTVTITSTEKGSLAITDVYGIATATSGKTISLTGTLTQVNTELASLTDTPSSGRIDIVNFSATDSSSNSASQNVGVRVAPVKPPASSTPGSPPSVFNGNGLLVVGGVLASYSASGNLQIGPSGTATTLLAALSPDAYSTATLAVGGTFEVMSGGTAYFTGSLSAPTMQVDTGGLLAGDGTLTASGGGAISNNGQIEAVADRTLGLEQLTAANALSGTGTLRIDAGATLILDGAVSANQTIDFADNTAAQLANDPYSPSTLTLAAPSYMAAAVSNFTYADRLVLDGVLATGATYAGGTLSVNASGGGTLTFNNFSVKNLSGVQPTVTQDTTDNLTTITFVPATTPAAPAAPTPVSQVLVSGTTTTITDQEDAQGSGGVAVKADSGGTLILAGGGVLTAEQEAIVGGTGQGQLALMGGALALTGASTSTALMVGEQGGSIGTVVDLEQITAAGTVVVGGTGTGTLDLRGVASSVTDGGAEIGQSAGGQGTASVNGGEWTNSGQLTVGGAGTGTLLIGGMNAGITGQVTAFNATIGNQAGGQGTVTLDGGEMLVVNNQVPTSTLTVGGGGTGTLTLQSGSEVAIGAAFGKPSNNSTTTYANTGALAVGSTAGGKGQVSISGNSALLVYGNATVGGGGTGQVTIGLSAKDQALFALIGALAVQSGGQVKLGGADATLRASTVTVGQGGVISGAGTLVGEIGGNDTASPASITNNGTIRADGNLLIDGDIGGTGTLAVAANATLTLEGTVGSGQTLTLGSGAEVVFADPAAFAGTITGFGIGDVLELGNTNATSATWSNGVLTVDPPPGPILLNMAGNLASTSFTVRSDGLGGSTISTGIVGTGFGDVHMITFDGLHYDFQAIGAFVAVQSADLATPWEIQIQTAAWGGAASVTTEIAAALGSDHVSITPGRANAVYLDGAPDMALAGTVQHLAGGTLAEISDGVYQIAWNAGESVTVADRGTYLDWAVGLGPHDGPATMRGLLGSDSGWASDFQLQDGTVLAQPSAADILGAFADAWRVNPGKSLLDDHSQLSALVQAMSANLVPAGSASDGLGLLHQDGNAQAPIAFSLPHG